jgi:predicted alpha/beta superfamily hydrolase
MQGTGFFQLPKQPVVHFTQVVIPRNIVIGEHKNLQSVEDSQSTKLKTIQRTNSKAINFKPNAFRFCLLFRSLGAGSCQSMHYRSFFLSLTYHLAGPTLLVMKKICFSLLCTLLFVFSLKAQDIFGKLDTFQCQSKITGTNYTLFVSLPPSYKANDTTRYPVLYVLDGNFMFPAMRSMQYLLSETNEIKKLIVVGIGHPATTILGSTKFRTPDFTPTRDTAFENMLTRELKEEIKTGGASQFLLSLKEDIFPLVEKKYRTSGRGIAGHSFGALFGAYVLFQEPSLFSHYLLSSVSFFWDNKVTLKNEEAFYRKQNKVLPATLFLTVGEQEGFMDMIPAMKTLAATLRGRNYQGLTVEERVLPHETHASSFLTAFNQGLRFLYSK